MFGVLAARLLGVPQFLAFGTFDRAFGFLGAFLDAAGVDKLLGPLVVVACGGLVAFAFVRLLAGRCVTAHEVLHRVGRSEQEPPDRGIGSGGLIPALLSGAGENLQEFAGTTAGFAALLAAGGFAVIHRF